MFDTRTDKRTLRIGTMNAEWLFDGIDDPNPSPWNSGSSSDPDCAGYANHLNGCDAAGAQLHLARVAAVVQRLRPDILNLVEVEGCAILTSLIDLLDDSDSYRPYLLKGTDSALGQNVGLITKISPTEPLTRSTARYSYPLPGSNCTLNGVSPRSGDTGVSKHYRTVFQLPEWTGVAEIAWFGVHFKAFPTDPDACAKREAQAQVIADMVRADIAAGREVVVCGDFNDFSAEILDQHGSVPTSHAVKLITDLNGDGVNELVNLISSVDHDVRYSDWWDHATASSTDRSGRDE